MADKLYFEKGTGVPSAYIPSLCAYTKASYTGSKDTFCLYGKREVYPEYEKLVEKPKKGYIWQDLCDFKAIVHEPYEISTMSVFEQITAGVPLFFPTRRFYEECIWNKTLRLISHYAYHAPREDYYVPDSVTEFYTSYDMWLDNADFYKKDAYQFKHVYYYDSFDDLLAQLETFEESDDIRQARKQWLDERTAYILADWKHELDFFFKPIKRQSSFNSYTYFSELLEAEKSYTICSFNSKKGIFQIRGYTESLESEFEPFDLIVDMSLNAYIIKSCIRWVNPEKANTYAESFKCIGETPSGLPFINDHCSIELIHHINETLHVLIKKYIIWVSSKHQNSLQWPIEPPKMIAPLHMVTFASSNIYLTLERIVNQANTSGYFNNIFAYTEHDIPEFMETHKKFISENRRLFGYAIWKPYIILKALNNIKDGEYLLYSDAGNSINPTVSNRVNDYIRMCKESPYKNVSMHLEETDDGLFQEKIWTKSDLFDHLNVPEKDRISSQIWSGWWLMEKCEFTMNILQQWLETATQYNLSDDTPSNIPNAELFVEHRHDQSILSCLLKLHGSYTIPKNEFDICEESWKFPFWATRIR
jgi:hypothetical protein